MLRRALLQEEHIEGVFWDYASLYQRPPGGERTMKEQDGFQRALKVMADLYASAVGTTVLQLEEIPECPADLIDVYNARPYLERGWCAPRPFRTLSPFPAPLRTSASDLCRAGAASRTR